MKTSPTISELAKALAIAQGEIDNAIKNSTNPHFRSNYANLAACVDACKSQLSKNGLSYVQSVTEAKDLMVTRLMHLSGEWIEGYTPLIITKQDMQGLGSAMTYGRRYGLTSLIGISQDDDDGEGCVSTSTQQTQPKPNVNASGEMLVPFGPNAGTPITQLHRKSIEGDIHYWRGREKSEGKPLSGKILAYVVALEGMLREQDGDMPQ